MPDTLRKQAEAAAREYLMIPDNYHGEAATAPRYVAVFLKHARPDAALAAENERLAVLVKSLTARLDKAIGKLQRADALAKATLAVMILDLEYQHDLRPLYGWAPIRHQLPWVYAIEILGDRADAVIASIEKVQQGQLEHGEGPVKTNPQKGQGSEREVIYRRLGGK